jgi:hypothetical protein
VILWTVGVLSEKSQLLARLLASNWIPFGFVGVVGKIPQNVLKPCAAGWAFAVVTTPLLNRQMFRPETKVKCVHPVWPAHAA